MIYALDTNIVSYLLRKDKQTQKNFLTAVTDGYECITPPMVYYEIKRWLLLKKATAQLREFDKLCYGTSNMLMDISAWDKAVEINVSLTQKGKIIDEADILIASYCLVNDYVLVTNNSRHFEEIDGLTYTNWKE